MDSVGIEVPWSWDFPCRPVRFQRPAAFLHHEYRVFSGVRRPERGADHTSPFSGELRIGWNYTFTSLLE